MDKSEMPYMQVAVTPVPRGITPESLQLGIDVMLAMIGDDHLTSKKIEQMYRMLDWEMETPINPENVREAKAELRKVLLTIAQKVYLGYSPNIAYATVECPCCGESIELAAAGGVTDDPDLIPSIRHVHTMYVQKVHRWIKKTPSEILAGVYEEVDHAPR